MAASTARPSGTVVMGWIPRPRGAVPPPYGRIRSCRTSPLLTGPPPDTSLAHLWATVLDELSRDPDISTANFSTRLRETQLIEGVGGAAAPTGAVDPDE